MAAQTILRTTMRVTPFIYVGEAMSNTSERAGDKIK